MGTSATKYTVYTVGGACKAEGKLSWSQYLYCQAATSMY